MPAKFQMSAKTLQAYRKLRYREDAERGCVLVPVGYVHWDDEYPADQRSPIGDTDAYHTLACLHAARWHYWMEEVIPDELAEIWEEAQEKMPEWPGFQRLYVDEETKQLARDCRSSADEFWQSCAEDADEVHIDDDGTGVGKVSLTINLDNDTISVPWWKRLLNRLIGRSSKK